MKVLAVVLLSLIVSGCVTTSSVMETEGGAYMVSARAAPAAGGTTGANTAAYDEAQKFCATKGGRAVVVDASERDVYQTSFGGGWSQSGGSFGGGRFAAGNANLRFRCVSTQAVR